jgi:hypothetical protein
VAARLARDPIAAVRQAAANRSLPYALTARLAHDADFVVNLRVTSSTNTPAGLLRRCAGHNPGQRTHAKRARSDYYADSAPTDEVRHRVAGNTNTPADTLLWLAAHPDPMTRNKIAANMSTPSKKSSTA